MPRTPSSRATTPETSRADPIAAQLARQKADIDNGAPGTSERALNQARAKIRRGDFRHGEEPDGDTSTR